MMQIGQLAFCVLSVGVFLTLWSDLLGIPGQADALPEKCKLPKDPGTGKAKLTVFYYNSQAKRCESFVYRGSGGNKNRFVRKQDCVKECGG